MTRSKVSTFDDEAQLLGQVLHGLPIAVAVLDRKLTYCLATPRWKKLFGLGDSDLSGRPLKELLPDLSLWDSHFEQVFRGVAASCAGEHIRASERMSEWVRWEMRPWMHTDGSVLGIFIFLENISEAVNARKELERQRSFLRQVIDINPSFIFAKDREGRFTLVNKATAEAYGTTVEALTGRRDADFNPNEEEVRSFRRDDIEVMDTGREKFIPEEVVTDAGGNLRFLQTVKRPIFDESGTASQILGIATDITVRRELEEIVRQTRKMDALGQLAGGIAHDFNNLLLVMMGFAEMALMSKAHQPPVADYLQRILEAGSNAQGVIQQLLAFSRKQKLELKPVNINSVVRNIHKMTRALIHNNIEIRLDLDEAIGSVHADESQLQQVILNLIINARDAIAGHGSVAIGTRLVREGQGAEGEPSQSFIELIVSDSGSGIPPEILPRIFDPFFSTKEKGKGSGLGLSTVYGIVKQHHGSVEVKSEPGRGTTFTVLLPLSGEAINESHEIEGSTELDFASATILVAEDDDLVRALIHSILDEAGYETIMAKDGFEALTLAESDSRPIQLLLADVIMPRMSGRELYDRLLHNRRELQVIYMSGQVGHAINEQLADMQMDILTKPFSKRALLERIRARLATIRAKAEA